METTKRRLKLQRELSQMAEETESALEEYVIQDILDTYETDEEITGYLTDLLSHGCQSGMVSQLIYYSDTHEFYNQFSDEIDELKESSELEMGQPLSIKGDTRNWLAWFGYEETARKIAYELDIEL